MAEARNLSDFEEIKHPSISVVPDEALKSAQKHKQKRKHIYFFSYIILAICTFASIILVVHMQNTVTKTSTAIVTQQHANATIKEKVEELTQEKSELSRADRVMKIGKEAGLVINDNNLRNVTK